LRDGADWQRVSAGSNRKSDWQLDNTDGTNRRYSSNLNCGVSIDTNGSTECHI